MIHNINSRARLVVSFYSALPLFQLEYRMPVLRIGRLVVYRWVSIRSSELVTKDHVSRCLCGAGDFLMSIQRNSESRALFRKMRQQKLGVQPLISQPA